MSWGKLCPLLMAAAWCYIIPCIFSAASWQRCMAAVAAPLASRAPLMTEGPGNYMPGHYAGCCFKHTGRCYARRRTAAALVVDCGMEGMQVSSCSACAEACM